MTKKNLYGFTRINPPAGGLSGFTLIESIFVISIIALLTGLVTINLFNIQDKTSLATTIDTLVSDIKQQQIKAMIGDTEGRASSDNYGIYFQQNDYILFHGSSFSPGDPSNITINLSQDKMQFVNIYFPSATLLFFKVSGEFFGFADDLNTISIRHNLSGEQKTIKINRYGAVTDIY